MQTSSDPNLTPLAAAVTTGLGRVSLAAIARPGRTLFDAALGDDRTAAIIALLAETNEILQGISFAEAIEPARVTIRSGLPSTAWRSLDQKVSNELPLRADP